MHPGTYDSDTVESTMSSKLPSILNPTDEDIQMLLSAQVHIGTKNCDKGMEPYVFKRRADGKLDFIKNDICQHQGFL